MYMPGRFRTGSSPSRTVMSFAVYAASAIRKALQISYLRAGFSVSETAVGRVAGEAESGRSLHSISQRFVLDSGNELGCAPQCIRGRLGSVRSRFRGHVGRWFRKVSDGEAQRLRRTVAEPLRQPRED